MTLVAIYPLVEAPGCSNPAQSDGVYGNTLAMKLEHLKRALRPSSKTINPTKSVQWHMPFSRKDKIKSCHIATWPL